MRDPVEAYIAQRRPLIEAALKRWIADRVEWPSHLHRALHYSLYPGGRRIRPLLAVAAYEAVAPVSDLAGVMPLAVALELIHSSVTVFDDLPALDDDDSRRGKPTNHRVHGEALAILAGGALQAMAFQVLTQRAHYPAGVDPALLLELAAQLAQVCGMDGIAGGQSMDLGYEQEIKAVEHLAFLYSKKTGGLIRESILCGARLGGASGSQLNGLATFGDRLGTALQLKDELVKEAAQTPSHPPRAVRSVIELLGDRETRIWLQRVVAEGLQAIEGLNGRAEGLRALARYFTLEAE